MIRVFITGGSGLLGSHIILELEKLGINYYAPSHTNCDILDINSIEREISQYNPSIVLHCAAIAKFKDVDNNPSKGIQINVIGTANIAQICSEKKIRLVFISTSHVFDGITGNYDVTDRINPISKYAKTKAAGEYIASICENHLIIRTEFCGLDFPFEVAYTNKWSSKDYIDIVTPKIIRAFLSDAIGVLHIGGVRKSFYEFAIERNPNVKPGKLEDSNILVDTSFRYQ